MNRGSSVIARAWLLLLVSTVFLYLDVVGGSDTQNSTSANPHEQPTTAPSTITTDTSQQLPVNDANATVTTGQATTTSTRNNEKEGEYFEQQAVAGLKPGTFKRMLYVLVGISSVVILYFVVKAVRLRSRASRIRQYDMLSRRNRDQDVELAPLDSGGDDDEDEDTTLFDKSVTGGSGVR